MCVGQTDRHTQTENGRIFRNFQSTIHFILISSHQCLLRSTKKQAFFTLNWLKWTHKTAVKETQFCTKQQQQKKRANGKGNSADNNKVCDIRNNNKLKKKRNATGCRKTATAAAAAVILNYCQHSDLPQKNKNKNTRKCKTHTSAEVTGNAASITCLPLPAAANEPLPTRVRVLY